MRIIFLTHNFPRWPGDVSGAFLASLGSALVDRGHEVRVIAPADEGNTGRIKFDGISVRRVRLDNRVDLYLSLGGGFDRYQEPELAPETENNEEDR